MEMTTKNTVAKMRDICHELQARSGDEWYISRHPSDPQYVQHYILSDHKGRGVCLHVGGYGRDNRIEVTGDWPSYVDNAGDTQTLYPRDGCTTTEQGVYKAITVSYDKSGERIASDIRTRFWAGYLSNWEQCKAKCLNYAKAGKEALAAATTLAKTLKAGKVTPHGSHASFYLNSVGTTSVYSYSDGVSVSLPAHVSSMNLSKAERVLKILLEND